jgi:hypothetical protein
VITGPGGSSAAALHRLNRIKASKHSTRTVHVQSSDDNLSLAKTNPFTLAKSIDAVCGTGAVDEIQHLKSGGIFITCKNIQSVKLLLKTTYLLLTNNNKIPIKVTIALTNQTVSGKIFAPEVSNESLDFLLSMLQPSGVVSIRKLLNDPAKTHVPLYILTFLGSTLPSHVTMSYSRYRVDPFIPSPMRCYKCCRWGHASYTCRSPAVCSQCGSKDHSKSTCRSLILSCASCKGNHQSFSRECPRFQQESDICHLKTRENISYPEARRQVLSKTSTTTNPASPTSLIASNHPPARSLISSNLSHHSIPISLPNNSLDLNQAEFPSLPRVPSRIAQHNPLSATPSLSHPTTASVSHNMEDIDSVIQDSVWITAAQRAGRQKQKSATLPSSQLSLIEDDSQHLQDPRQSTPSPIQDQQSAFYSRPAPSQTEPSPSSGSSLFQSLKQYFITLLPILIKLVLSHNQSSKIECLLELGSVLQIDSTVISLLTDLGFSSISSSQA